MNNTTTNNSTIRIATRRRRNKGMQDFINYARNVCGALESLLTPLIVLANILVIVVILSNPKLRRQFPYLVIVSICISEVITGMLTCPVRAGVLIGKTYTHGCGTYIFITVYEEFVQNFVASWGMISLNIDYLLSLFNVRLPQLTEFKRKLVLATLVFLPWVTMGCVLFPIAFTYYGKVYFTKTFCQVTLTKAGKGIMVHITYVLPSILLGLQILIITACYIHRRRKGIQVSPDLLSPAMLAMASAVVVLFVSLQQSTILMGTRALSSLGYRTILVVLYTAFILADFTGAVLPFIWFLSADIRSSCLDLYNKLPWRRSVDAFKSDLSVTYKNFE